MNGSIPCEAPKTFRAICTTHVPFDWMSTWYRSATQWASYLCATHVPFDWMSTWYRSATHWASYLCATHVPFDWLSTWYRSATQRASYLGDVGTAVYLRAYRLHVDRYIGLHSLQVCRGLACQVTWFIWIITVRTDIVFNQEWYPCP